MDSHKNAFLKMKEKTQNKIIHYFLIIVRLLS